MLSHDLFLCFRFSLWRQLVAAIQSIMSVGNQQAYVRMLLHAQNNMSLLSWHLSNFDAQHRQDVQSILHRCLALFNTILAGLEVG